VAIAGCLIAARPPQIVGDGGEYLVYALNFAALRGPSLRTADLEPLKQQVVAYAPELDVPEFYQSAVPGRDRRRDFMHFWFFSLAATPFVWIAQAARVPAVYAFFGLNLTLLLIALRVALPRIGRAWSAFLFASPLLWWIDKPHTEMCTVCLIAIALLLICDSPWWAMVALGAASTQYPPLVVGVPLVAAAAVIANRAWLRDRRFQYGLATALALAVLHPAYYYVRHGTPSLLLNVSNTGAPTWAEWSAVLVSPDIGLFASFPLWPVVVLAALILLGRRRRWALFSVEAIVAMILGVFFLAVFGKKDNVHHGATPSLSRYALWFIPLAIPWLRSAAAVGGGGWRWFAGAAAVISASISIFAFHPSVPQNSREPTWLANFLWTRHPGWNNPLPEVFAEAFSHTDDPFAPTFTGGCEKLLIGGMTPAGTWPLPCYPPGLPLSCRSEGVWCYANRTAHDYDVIKAPGRWNPRPRPRPDLTWPIDSEQAVRDLFHEWEWWDLRQNVVPWWLRQVTGVRVFGLTGADRFILVLRDPQPGASLVFRLPRAMTGKIVNGHWGGAITNLQFGGAPWDQWAVPLPASSDLLLLAMRGK